MDVFVATAAHNVLQKPKKKLQTTNDLLDKPSGEFQTVFCRLGDDKIYF